MGKASDTAEVKRKALFYHGFCAMFSNGIWIGSQFILVGTFIDILKRGSWFDGIITGLVYMAGTMIGSLTTHYLALHKLEKHAGI